MLDLYYKELREKDRIRLKNSNWWNVYNDYYEYDKRIVKIVKFKEKGLWLEKLEGFRLDHLDSLRQLSNTQIRFVLNEIMDIYSNQFQFQHESLSSDQVFIHNDVQLGNFMYCDGEVRLIDPEAFQFRLINVWDIHYAKIMESIFKLSSVIGERTITTGKETNGK